MRFIIIIIITFLFIAIRSSFGNKCIICNKLFTLELVDKTELSREKCSKLEELETKDKRGNVTGTRQARRYGEKIKYRVTYKCRYCQHITIKFQEEEEYQ